jgi:acetoin utilization deacetylase AcuC-like enzyme
MFTTIISHSLCAEHKGGDYHPERPERLAAVLHALEAEEFAYLPRVEAPEATIEQLARVHDRSHIEFVFSQVPEQGEAEIDGDTFLSPQSGKAALRAAGAVVHGVDLILDGHARTVFCAVRPPGHHAEPNRAMGFCLFNNIAIGAYHARTRGLKRLAIVDFDVHHGNGSQAVAQKDGDLFFASTHQYPLYPGTGRADECGPRDNIVNVPLPSGAGGDDFRQAFDSIILPRLEHFAPEMIFISAGFDAHWRDPLAGLDLSEQDFGWATQRLVSLADRICKGRVLSSLEGGYDLDALARSTTHHVRGLMGA